MPINPDLLIAAPMLQDPFVDKDGTPMSGGTITCYQDNSRTTLKNWYYQSSNFADNEGKYTFSRLPNPLTLSAAGTICDINGVDTIPFFYPYSELDETESQPYYITIVNHAQTNQITRPNFPYNREDTEPETHEVALNNLIINNGFWRNLKPNYLNQTAGGITLNSIMTSMPYNVWTGISTLYGAIVSPSQHDGFSMPDLQFLKNNLSGTDVCTFTPFPASTDLVIPNTISPEYYVNHVCSAAGSGEIAKCYQFPISLHLNNLANYPFTVSIQAQNNGLIASGSNVIQLNLLQFTGSGSASPTPSVIGTTTLTLTSQWTTYTISSVFPSSSGLSLSLANDDAWYLQIQMPLNVTCNINFTKPSIYLTENITPQNDLLTYDQVEAIINSPRTGDIRTSLNSFTPFGWTPANDGTIGNVSSGATSRANADTWPLFNMIWTLFSAFNNGSTNLLAQMYDSAGTGGAARAYGATSLIDFNANRQLSLTKLMGKVILGTVPPSVIIGYISTFTVTANVFTAANNLNLFLGMPIKFTGTSTLSTSTIYYISGFNGTNTFTISTTFLLAIQGNIYSIASDSGTVYSAITGSYEGEYAHTQILSEIASHTHDPLSPSTAFRTVNSAGLFSHPSGSGADEVSTTGGISTRASTPANPANVTQPGTFYNMYFKL